MSSNGIGNILHPFQVSPFSHGIVGKNNNPDINREPEKKVKSEVLSPSCNFIRQFFNENLVDEEGNVDRSFQDSPLPPLLENQKKNIDQFLNKSISIEGTDFPFKLRFTPKAVLKELCKRLSKYDPKVEIVGSAVSYLLGVDYFERVLDQLSKGRLKDIPRDLRNAIEGEPSDFDIRIYVDEKKVHLSFDSFDDIVLDVLGDIIKESEACDAVSVCTFLREKGKGRFNTLKPDSPNLYSLLLKNDRSIKKPPAVCNDEIHYSMVGVGRPRIEFMVMIRMRRKQMFTQDALRLGLEFFSEAGKEGAIINLAVEKGISGYQAAFDRVGNLVRVPNINLVTKDDFVVLNSKKTKFAAICPQRNIESMLLNKFQPENEITKKSISEFIRILKKLMKNHHRSNLSHAFAWMITTCLSMMSLNKDAEESYWRDIENIWQSVLSIFKDELANIDVKEPFFLKLIKTAYDKKITLKEISELLQIIAILNFTKPKKSENPVSSYIASTGKNSSFHLRFNEEQPYFITLPINSVPAVSRNAGSRKIPDEFYRACLSLFDFGVEVSSQIGAQLDDLALNAADLHKLSNGLLKSRDKLEVRLGYELLFVCQSIQSQEQYILDMLHFFPKAMLYGTHQELLIENLKRSLACSKMSFLLKDTDFLKILDEAMEKNGIEKWRWMKVLAKSGDPLILDRVYQFWLKIVTEPRLDKEVKEHASELIRIFLASNRDKAVKLYKDCCDVIDVKESFEVLLQLMPSGSVSSHVLQLVDLRFFGEKAISFLPDLNIRRRKKKGVEISGQSNAISLLIQRLYEFKELDIGLQLWLLAVEKGYFSSHGEEAIVIEFKYFTAIWKEKGALSAAYWYKSNRERGIFNDTLSISWTKALVKLSEELIAIDELTEGYNLINGLCKYDASFEVKNLLINGSIKWLEKSLKMESLEFFQLEYFLNMLIQHDFENKDFQHLLKQILWKYSSQSKSAKHFVHILCRTDLMELTFPKCRERNELVASFSSHLVSSGLNEEVIALWDIYPFCLDKELKMFCKSVCDSGVKHHIVKAFQCLKILHVANPKELKENCVDSWMAFLKAFERIDSDIPLSLLRNHVIIDAVFGSANSNHKTAAWSYILIAVVKNQKSFDQTIWNDVFGKRRELLNEIQKHNNVDEKVDLAIALYAIKSSDCMIFLTGSMLIRVIFDKCIEDNRAVSPEYIVLIDNLIEASRNFLESDNPIGIDCNLASLFQFSIPYIIPDKKFLLKRYELILKFPHFSNLSLLALKSGLEIIESSKDRAVTSTLFNFIELALSHGDNAIWSFILFKLNNNSFLLSDKQISILVKKTLKKYLEHLLRLKLCGSSIESIILFQRWHLQCEMDDQLIKLLFDHIEKLLLFYSIDSHAGDRIEEMVFFSLFDKILSCALVEKDNAYRKFSNLSVVFVYLFKSIMQSDNVPWKDKARLIVEISSRLSNHLAYQTIDVESLGFLLEMFEEMVFSIPMPLDDHIHNWTRSELGKWVVLLKINDIVFDGIVGEKCQNLKMYLAKKLPPLNMTGEFTKRAVKRMLHGKGAGNVYAALVFLVDQMPSIRWASQAEVSSCVRMLIDHCSDHFIPRVNQHITILNMIIPMLIPKEARSMAILTNGKSCPVIAEETHEYYVDALVNQSIKLKNLLLLSSKEINEVMMSINGGIIGYAQRGTKAFSNIEKIMPLSIHVINIDGPDLEIDGTNMVNKIRSIMLYCHLQEPSGYKVAAMYFNKWIKYLLSLENQDAAINESMYVLEMCVINKVYSEKNKSQWQQASEMIRQAKEKNI